MTPQIDVNETDIINLKSFLEQNRSIDFKKFNLLDEVNTANLNWLAFDDIREKLLAHLKGYQRLIRIIPEEKEEAAFLLLKNGIHSALQICSMSRKEYMNNVSTGFSGDLKTAEKIYGNALEKRGIILLQYMNMLQKNEPHITAARFN